MKLFWVFCSLRSRRELRENGRHRYVLITSNDEQVRFLSGLSTPVARRKIYRSIRARGYLVESSESSGANFLCRLLG